MNQSVPYLGNCVAPNLTTSWTSSTVRLLSFLSWTCSNLELMYTNTIMMFPIRSWKNCKITFNRVGLKWGIHNLKDLGQEPIIRVGWVEVNCQYPSALFFGRKRYASTSPIEMLFTHESGYVITFIINNIHTIYFNGSVLGQLIYFPSNSFPNIQISELCVYSRLIYNAINYIDVYILLQGHCESCSLFQEKYLIMWGMRRV